MARQEDALGLRRLGICRAVYECISDCGGQESKVACFLFDGRADLLEIYVLYGDIAGNGNSESESCRDPRRGHTDDLWIAYYENETLVSPTSFFSEHMEGNMPALVRGVSETWPCRQHWLNSNGALNLDAFEASFSEAVGKVTDCEKEDVRMGTAVRDYVTWWRARADSQQALLYLKDVHICKVGLPFQPYQVPEVFQDDWLNDFHDACAASPDYRFLYAGPGGTSTPIHCDVLHSFAWSANVCGRKCWLLIPPSQTHLLYDRFGQRMAKTLADNPFMYPWLRFVTPFEILQGPTDAVFVPAGWRHWVMNLEDCVSINTNFINAANLDRVVALHP
eukprot:jgi/Botrbrau1/16451/Bobra.0142s0047.1